MAFNTEEEKRLRYGLYSDIHGNLEALETVVKFFEEQKVEKYLCLGDIVGYGANPKECLEKVIELESVIVAGNHDYAIAGNIDISYFNPFAQQAVLWTREQLDDKHIKFLKELDLVHEIEETLTLVHGSLNFPEMFDYIQSIHDALLSLEILNTPVCFYGHSHVPIAFIEKERITYCLDSNIPIKNDQKVLINVGSVGQPRDGNPLASCAIYDDKEGQVIVHRLEYDIETAVEKILNAGLPEVLGERLRYGR